MNWHFIFFLLDVVSWITVAVLLCNYAFITRSNKANLNNFTKLNIIIIAPFAGLFSVLINGIPETGFAVNSFIYVFIVSFSLVFYQRIKTRKDYLPKISKRNRKVAYA